MGSRASKQRDATESEVRRVLVGRSESAEDEGPGQQPSKSIHYIHIRTSTA